MLPLLVGGLMLFCTSCTMSFVTVTNNPIGSKVGVAKERVLFNPDADYSYKKAANNGNVDKIGATEFQYKYFIIPLSVKTSVYGE